jgi:hypothetical protein
MTDTLQSYRQDPAIKGFSPKTQATGQVVEKPPDALAKDDTKSHLFRILGSGKCSSSTINQTYTPILFGFLFPEQDSSAFA